MSTKGKSNKARWLLVVATLLMVLSACGYGLARWLRPAWFRDVLVPRATSASIWIDGDTLFLGYVDFGSRDCGQTRCPLARLDALSLDTGAKTTLVWTNQVFDVVATPTHVVWRDSTCTLTGCAGYIHAVPKTGGDVLSVAQKDPFPPQVAGELVFWFDGSDRALRSWKVPNGTPQVLVQPSSWFFAVHEGYLFYSVVEGGLVMKVPVGGGPAVQVVSGLVQPKWLAIIGTDIYVACASSPDNDESGVVMRLGLDGGPTQQLAVYEKEVSDFLVAEGFLYYVVSEYETSPDSLDPTFALPIFAQPLAGGPTQRFVDGTNTKFLAHKGYLYVAPSGEPAFRKPLASSGGCGSD